MGWFSKKKVIDLTQNKPSVQSKPVLSSLSRSSSSGYKDLTSNQGNALSFLGTMAGAGDSSQDIVNVHSSLQTKDMARKIDDVEFKLDSMSRRLSSIIDRLDVAEKKIGRIEGRGS